MRGKLLKKLTDPVPLTRAARVRNFIIWERIHILVHLKYGEVKCMSDDINRHLDAFMKIILETVNSNVSYIMRIIMIYLSIDHR